MFEAKNEVDEKIGDVGHVKVDITPQMEVDSEISVGIQKDLLPKIPGALTVDLQLVGKIHGDPVAIGIFYLSQSTNSTVKFMAEQLAKLKGGQAIHPDVQAAADAHISA